MSLVQKTTKMAMSSLLQMELFPFLQILCVPHTARLPLQQHLQAHYFFWTDFKGCPCVWNTGVSLHRRSRWLIRLSRSQSSSLHTFRESFLTMIEFRKKSRTPGSPGPSRNTPGESSGLRGLRRMTSESLHVFNAE